MPSRLLRPFMLCALVAAALPAAIARPGPAPSLRLEPIAFKLRDGLELPAERGTFSVPEDRGDPTSRRIDIGFVRFKSTNPRPGAPIVYLAGGPGGSGVGAAHGERQPIFLALRRIADVIALDQRGVGLSNHIPPCTAPAALDSAAPLSEATLTAYYRATLAQCVAKWRAAGVAIGGYDTEQSAADIETLRRAVGANKLSLWGISYGTHLALATMRRYPGSVERVVLASAEGLDQTVKRPAHVDAALARIEAMLRADPTARPFHDLTAKMRRVHARFDADPQVFEAKGADGAPIRFRADSFPLRMLATFVPKNPDGIAQFAGAYAALDHGQTAALAPLVHDYFYKRPLVMGGMPELMDIASGISGGKLAAVRAEARTALAGTATNFPMPQLRGMVAGIDLGDGFRRELRSAIPVLLLSGDLDVRTPLEEQAEATRGLTRLHRVIVRNGGHDLFEAHPAVPTLIEDFLAGRRVTTTELRLDPPRFAR